MTSRFPNLVTSLGLAVMAGISYNLLGRFGLLFTIPSMSLSVFWPPNAGTLAILLLSHKRYWSFIFVGSMLGDFPNELALTNGGYNDSIIMVIMDSLSSLLPALVIRKFAGDTYVRNCMSWFILLIISYTMVSSFCGLVVSLAVYDNKTLNDVVSTTLTWVMSDITSVLIIVTLSIAVFELISSLKRNEINFNHFAHKVSGFCVLVLFIGIGSYYEFFVYYPIHRVTINLFLPFLLAASYYYGLIGAGVGCAIIMIGAGLTPLMVNFGSDPGTLTNIVFQLQANELFNIIAAILLACVTTKLRYANRDLIESVKRAESALERAERGEREARYQANEIELIYMYAPIGLCLM
ncbi:MAG: MASE1 domain-containing protein, partial [Rhodospirillaceae bacterium]